ncbi:MAG: hypothetical protein COW13_00540, partial [Candidatus Omnitrophica bacterium CG12_big_fil_rev_8_21_14_0_65_50_5]
MTIFFLSSFPNSGIRLPLIWDLKIKQLIRRRWYGMKSNSKQRIFWKRSKMKTHSPLAASKVEPFAASPLDLLRVEPRHLMVFIKKLGRPVFTTHELTAISGKSASTVVQCLNRLARQGLLVKVYRGVWAQTGPRPLSAFEIIPCLFPRRRVYVS